jgi:hypothetical protein
VKKHLAGVAGVLAVVGLVAPAAPAQADDRSLSIGNAWLVRQLDGGVVHNDQYDFDDVGLTIDTALALDAIDAPPAQLDRVENGLQDVVDGYVQSDEYDFTTGEFVQVGYYAGSASKALVAAQLLDADPTAFGGVDLVDATEDRVLDAAPVTGRIADDSSYGDYANTFGQSFAARGLSDAGSADAASVVDFLLEQQCADGGFRQSFTTDKTATEQGCAGSDTSDVDTTALVVLNLVEIDAPTTEVSTAIGNATDWLAGEQATDGSFSGTGTGAANSNSTGLAGWALGRTGDTTAAANAAARVRQIQTVNNGRCTSELNSEQGAIALNQAAFDAGQANGITDNSQDQWRRATTQALPGQAWAPEAEGARNVTGGTTDFVAAGSVRTIGATGIAPGDRVCAWTSTGAWQRPAAADGTVAIPVRVPATTGEHVLTVTDSSGTVNRTTFNALAARTLAVTFRAAQVRQGGTQRITVGGLAAGESVRVVVRGKQVASGTAGSDGSYAVTVRLPAAQYPVGSTTVRVTGEFANRTGSKAFRVTR